MKSTVFATFTLEAAHRLEKATTAKRAAAAIHEHPIIRLEHARLTGLKQDDDNLPDMCIARKQS